jgi:hypothetical protein
LNDFTEVEPTISNISVSNSTPALNETVTITTLFTDENEVYLGYRNESIASFSRVQMYDDGTHNDVLANDGIYGVEIKITGELTQYYIYAENDVIGKFSPVRAKYEYHTLTATIENPIIGDLVINEFMASNNTTVMDQDGEFEDWIELYNNGTSSIDLSGYYITDDDSDLTQWTLPDGTTIEPDGYLIIWADDDEDQEGLHANFKLSASGESVILVNVDTSIVDAIDYPEQTTDISYARIPNGTGDFQFMDPTFNSENSISTNTINIASEMQEIKIYPNPASNEITVLSNIELANISIYNQSGQKVMDHSLNSRETKIDISQLPIGMYFILTISPSANVETHKINVMK